MEVVKNNLIIDTNYKPSLNQDHHSFFMRAMAFAQTNYIQELNRITKTNFIKLSPTYFYEEYCWVVCNQNTDIKIVSDYFYNLLNTISPLCYLFLDQNFNDAIDISDDIFALLGDKKKTDAIIKTSNIMYNGIKIFNWDFYKDNYLSSPQKIMALPLMEEESSQKLLEYTGNNKYFGGYRLRKLAEHWKFKDPAELCLSIQKIVNLKIQVIAAILWYAYYTFIENHEIA